MTVLPTLLSSKVVVAAEMSYYSKQFLPFLHAGGVQKARGNPLEFTTQEAGLRSRWTGGLGGGWEGVDVLRTEREGLFKIKPAVSRGRLSQQS